MANYPALPEEFQSALAWMEAAGSRVKVLSFDRGRHEVNIEMFMPDSKTYVQWVLYVDEDDLVRRRLPGKLGKGIAIRMPNVSEAVTRKIVKRQRKQRRRQVVSELREVTPESSEAMERWKERAHWIRKCRELEDRFIKEPTPQVAAQLMGVRDILNQIETDLVMYQRVVTGASE